MPRQKKQFIRLQEYNNKRRKLAQENQEKGILGEERIFEEETIEFYGEEGENEATDRADKTDEEEETDRTDKTDEEKKTDRTDKTDEEEETDRTDETDEEENKKADEEEEKIRTRLLTTLVWKNAERENTRIIKGIPKTTYYRKFGTSGSLSKAAKGTHKITNFFTSGSSASSATSTHTFSTSTSFESSALSVADKDGMEAILCERVAQLRNELLENGQIFTAFEYNRRRAVYEYLIRLNDNGKMKASQKAANMVYIAPMSCTAKKIHFLAKFYLQNESFPLSNRGQHQKYK